MADLITLAGKIVKIALIIHEVVEEVKDLPEYAKKLDFKIQLMKPILDTLTSMKDQRQQLQDMCKHEPQLDLFGDSLSKMLACIEEVKDYVDDIKDMSYPRKVLEKKKKKQEFERLEWELNELQKSIQFGVITEVRKAIESNQKVNKVQTFIEHVRNSGTTSTASGRGETSSHDKAEGESSAGM